MDKPNKFTEKCICDYKNKEDEDWWSKPAHSPMTLASSFV